LSITIFTATGCTRCKIVKEYMDCNGIRYLEKDMKAGGKDDFQFFYKENRSLIYRGAQGIEFPIITDGKEIRQGIGASIAFLKSGSALDGFFSVGTLRKEWVDGIHISSGSADQIDDFIAVLKYLKQSKLSLFVETNGKNSKILEQVNSQKLADAVVMKILGSEEIYKKLDPSIEIADIKKSMALVAQMENHKFEITIFPIIRDNGEISYMTPEEVGEAAKFLEEGTGSKKNTLIIKAIDPQEATMSEYKALEPLLTNDLFVYRTKARKYQVFADIDKSNKV